MIGYQLTLLLVVSETSIVNTMYMSRPVALDPHPRGTVKPSGFVQYDEYMSTYWIWPSFLCFSCPFGYTLSGYSYWWPTRINSIHFQSWFGQDFQTWQKSVHRVTQTMRARPVVLRSASPCRWWTGHRVPGNKRINCMSCQPEKFNLFCTSLHTLTWVGIKPSRSTGQVEGGQE